MSFQAEIFIVTVGLPSADWPRPFNARCPNQRNGKQIFDMLIRLLRIADHPERLRFVGYSDQWTTGG